MIENEISGHLIWAAIEVHKVLGPGLLESAYKECLLLVENKVVIEVKSVEALNDVHLAQTLTYMKLGGYKLGLLINFNVVKFEVILYVLLWLLFFFLIFNKPKFVHIIKILNRLLTNKN